MSAKALILIALVIAVPVSGFALGIRVFDHDAFATARGNAFVATADNAAAIYYNPAGITQLGGHNARAAVNIVNSRAGFENRLLQDVNTGDDIVALPGFFYTYTPMDRPFSFGAGYYQPYSLSLEWPERGPFGATAIRGELQYHTLNPIIAWKVTRSLSVAAGPTLNYSSAELRPSVAVPGDEFRFRGDDHDFGASAGILWQPAKRHSFGLSYRSSTTMSYEGESRVQAAAYSVPPQKASAELPFPHVLVLGYSFRPTLHWNLEVDVDWSDWNRVNTLVIKQRSGSVPLPLRWKSSYAVELGATRYFDNGMHLSGGYTYVENSVPNRSFTPLIPDQDLHVFSAGVGGKYKRVTWDATYQFTYGPSRDVAGSLYGPAVTGNYTFIAHAFSLSFGYSF